VALLPRFSSSRSNLLAVCVAEFPLFAHQFAYAVFENPLTECRRPIVRGEPITRGVFALSILDEADVNERIEVTYEDREGVVRQVRLFIRGLARRERRGDLPILDENPS